MSTIYHYKSVIGTMINECIVSFQSENWFGIAT